MPDPITKYPLRYEYWVLLDAGVEGPLEFLRGLVDGDYDGRVDMGQVTKEAPRAMLKLPGGLKYY